MNKPLPLFPLSMTLFPGGRLPLQVFETRYLDMVKDCMKMESGFVIVSIRQGHEVGEAPDVYDVGTYAEIIDWNTLPNGLLGITIEGKYRVKLSDFSENKQHLMQATTENIEHEQSVLIPEKYTHFIDILKSIKNNPVVQSLNININYRCAFEVSARLTELLPFDVEDKQSLLELQDPIERLARLQALLDVLGSNFNIV